MPRESNDPLFAHFDSEQHRLWKQDRLLRQAVPIAHAWRGCLGLAMLLSDVERTEYPTDRQAVIPNDCVTWLALRDVPRNHFPACPAMNRREVHYANAARAELRHGMPVIDLTRDVRDAWDLRFMPIGRYQRDASPSADRVVRGRGDVLNSDERPVEFAVLNRLSAAMTRFAFCAVDARGCPLRRPAVGRRPAQGLGAVLAVAARPVDAAGLPGLPPPARHRPAGPRPNVGPHGRGGRRDRALPGRAGRPGRAGTAAGGPLVGPSAGLQARGRTIGGGGVPADPAGRLGPAEVRLARRRVAGRADRRPAAVDGADAVHPRR